MFDFDPNDLWDLIRMAYDAWRFVRGPKGCTAVRRLLPGFRKQPHALPPSHFARRVTAKKRRHS
jgi:hypothetical protein